MVFLLSLLLGLVLAEMICIFLRQGWHRVILEKSARAVRIIQSPYISDHWKERVLLMYSGLILSRTLLLASALVALAATVAVFHWLGSLLGVDLWAFLCSWVGLAYLTVIAGGFAWLRNRFV